MTGQPVGYKRATVLHLAHSPLHHVSQAKMFLQKASHAWTNAQPSLILECTNGWSLELGTSEDFLKFWFLSLNWPGRDHISAATYISLRGKKKIVANYATNAKLVPHDKQLGAECQNTREGLHLHLQSLRSVDRLGVFLSVFLKSISFNWFQRKPYKNQTLLLPSYIPPPSQCIEKSRLKDGIDAINLTSPIYSGKLKLSVELNVFKLMDSYLVLIFRNLLSRS